MKKAKFSYVTFNAFIGILIATPAFSLDFSRQERNQLKFDDLSLDKSLLEDSESNSKNHKKIISISERNESLKPPNINVVSQVPSPIPMPKLPPENPMSQVTSVSQLTDLLPTDWAFQALQSLIERYGCIAGYPDGTYRGNRALTRYEFAAGLNACLDRINELIASGTNNFVTREDLNILQRLQEEFATELAVLRGRTDTLEARTAELEANQFSTTTKLTGEVIFAASGAFGEKRADEEDEKIDENIVVSHRTYLFLNTSFNGQDRLVARLEARNTPNFAIATGTEMSRFGFDGDNSNTFRLGELAYQFPIGTRGRFYIEATGGAMDIWSPTLNPLDGDGNGAVSNFGLRNPVYRISGGGGVGFSYNLTDSIHLSGGYLAGDGADPSPGSGIFDGSFGALGQVLWRPVPALGLAFTYQRSFKIPTGGGTGSIFANDPFEDISTSGNAYGIEASWRLSPRFIVSGWGGLIKAHAENGDYKGADASISTWAVTLAFPDLGKEGSLGGIIIGQPPKAFYNEARKRQDRDTALHFEVFYRYQLTDNLAITPGFFWITNPEHDRDNDSIYMGTIRTTFSF